jgi:hypothetical protein
MTMRTIRAFGILIMIFCPGASAADLWTFNGTCEHSDVRQGPPLVKQWQDEPGPAISCDSVSITQLDNGRVLVQFARKAGEMLLPGFAGGRLGYIEGSYTLIIDRVYPQRPLAGKQPDQIEGEAAQTAMPAGGYCYFGIPDFSRLKALACVASTRNADTKFLYSFFFQIDDISVKRDVPASAQAPLPESAPSAPAGDQAKTATGGTFDRIFEYTHLDRTLPDGKHPVWIYYQSAETIVRVDMPSLDMCAVTPRSAADWRVIRSGHVSDVSKTASAGKSSSDWDFVLEIWSAAFQRHLIVGKPKAC